MDLSSHTLLRLAQIIDEDWRPRPSAYDQFVTALLGASDGWYGADSEEVCIRYFLANARGWRGVLARRVKAELLRRLKTKDHPIKA